MRRVGRTFAPPAAIVAIVVVVVAAGDAQAAHTAQPEPTARPEPVLQPEPAADLWGFDDEVEEAETWAALLRDQAADLALFAGFAALTLIGFFRKSVALKYVTLAAAVAWLGFAKSQLISVVNVHGVMTGNLPVFRYSLAWYLFAGFTVVTTVLWGRLYCGRVCAFGALKIGRAHV